MKILWILFLVAAQDAPWSADATATRRSALEAKKPCILLVNSDTGAH
jgi:hypothetical protein